MIGWWPMVVVESVEEGSRCAVGLCSSVGAGCL